MGCAAGEDTVATGASQDMMLRSGGRGARRLGQEDRDAGLPLPVSDSRSACVRAGIVVGPLFRFNCSCLAECVDEGLRHVRTSCIGCLGR